MADRLAAEIEIGGTVSASLVAGLCAAINEDGLRLEWDGGDFHPRTAQDLLDAAEGGVLTLCDDQASWGSFPVLEGFLAEHYIGFTRTTEAKYEYDAEIIWFRSGAEGIQTRLTTQDQHVVVQRDELLPVLDALRRQDMASARRQLEQVIGPDIPPLGPLRIVGDV